MKHQEARQWVMDGMKACLPPDVPLPFNAVTNIVSAKKSSVTATVEMFDGRSGTIEVSQQEWVGGFKSWCLRWQDLPGGTVDWNGANWERVNKLVEQDEQVKQLVMF